MALFRFRLDKVLRLRHQEVEAARRELRAAQAAEQAAAGALAEIQAQMQARVTGAVTREARGLTALDFTAHRRHLAYLQQQADQAQQTLDAARVETARRRQALVALRRRERVLERLRDLRLAQHAEAVVRQDQGFLDELAVQARARAEDESQGG